MVRLDPGQVFLEARREPRRHERPVQHTVGEGIADHGRRQRRRQRRKELRIDRLVHDGRPERRAPLPRRTEAPEQRARDGERQIGVCRDDHRVLAAQLQARRLQVLAGEGPDRRAHVGRPGEADLVDQSLVEGGRQALERRLSRGVHDREHAVRYARPRDQRTESGGARGGVLGRLPDDRVAAEQRRHDVPGRHGHREVARRDDGRHPDRHPEREQLLVRHLGGHRLPVQPPPLAEEEIARVDDFLHLATRLGQRLAHLAGDQPRERVEVVPHQPPEIGDHLPPDRRRHARPSALGVAGFGARGHEVGRGGQRYGGHDVVEPGGVQGLVLHGPRRPQPAAPDPSPSSPRARRGPKPSPSAAP